MMLSWTKKQLTAWVEKLQRSEIARLRQENLRLKERIKQETGKSIQLTPEERRLLAEKAERVDPETLNQISVLDPEDFNTANHEADSTENR